MAEDPYQVLGVGRDASQADIKRAFHKLAKLWHPDLKPGDAAAEARFKSISAANELLSDPERRAAFDRGEIDASGQPAGPPPNWRGFAEGAEGMRYRTSSASYSDEDLGDIFGDIFGRRQRSGPIGGRDEHYVLAIDFLDAVNGATRRLTLPDGGTLDVRVPAGIETGQTLRLRGKGGPGSGGAPDGDALIEVRVSDGTLFRREGNDIHLDLPVSLREAVLGAKVQVPTPRGTVSMTIPPRSDTGRQLRLRGRGVAEREGRAAGDFYVTLRVVIGTPDASLEAFLREWEGGGDPRRGMGAP